VKVRPQAQALKKEIRVSQLPDREARAESRVRARTRAD